MIDCVIPDVIHVLGHVVEEVLGEGDLDGGVVPAVRVAPEPAGDRHATCTRHIEWPLHQCGLAAVNRHEAIKVPQQSCCPHL